MDYGNCVSVCGCVYPACRDGHVFICYSMLMCASYGHMWIRLNVYMLV